MGGYPIPRRGFTPVLDRGYPSGRWGGSYSLSWGYPSPNWGGEYPNPGQKRYPSFLWLGYPQEGTLDERLGCPQEDMAPEAGVPPRKYLGPEAGVPPPRKTWDQTLEYPAKKGPGTRGWRRNPGPDVWVATPCMDRQKDKHQSRHYLHPSFGCGRLNVSKKCPYLYFLCILPVGMECTNIIRG